MVLNCISSGSSANCFFLTNSKGEILILDAGVSIDRIMANKRFTMFKNVVGALITHCHKDHSLSVSSLELAGVSVSGYMSLTPLKRYFYGSYAVIPFLVKHDVPNYGYIISEVGDKSKFVYATDCAELPLIADVDNWLIECNYCTENWNVKLASENANLKYLGRVLDSHMNLDALCEYFDKINKKADKIILCHLSENGNADKDLMISKMSRFAKEIDVATKNKEWRLN